MPISDKEHRRLDETNDYQVIKLTKLRLKMNMLRSTKKLASTAACFTNGNYMHLQ